MLYSGSIVAGTGGVIALGLYVAGYRRLFFPGRFPFTRWNGLAVCLAFIIFLTGSLFAQAILHRTKFYHQVYGPDSTVANPPQDVVLPAVGAGPDNLDDARKASANNTLRLLWSSVFAFPLQLGAILLLRRWQGTPRALIPSQPANNFVAGYLTWLIVTPLAYIIFVLANYLHHELTGKPPDKHPLTQMGDVAGRLEYILFFCQTVLIAPVIEEVIFRGMMLSWIMSRKANPDGDPALTVPPPFRSLLVMLLSLAVTAIIQLDSITKMVAEDSLKRAMAHLVPILFFAALIPAFVLLPNWTRLRRHLRIRSANDVRAIMAASALFAAFHASVWPSPVPLLVLSIGLSFLYARTRSLIGPIVVHSMFNAVSAIHVLLGGPV
jgi:membrane protease YdiL (CAAX protease family)